jgi:hypothetical protein
MIVTAALMWSNEDPELLEACVRSTAKVADRIVAVDGSWGRYPGGTIRSSQAEEDAIREAAQRVGLDCDIYIPVRGWLGQVEKRTFLYQRAAQGSDWIAVMDADYVLHAKWEAVRKELEQSQADVYEIPFVTPSNPMGTMTPGPWHEQGARGVQYHSILYRALPGIQAERRHFFISALKNGERVWLMHGDDAHPHLPAYRLTAEYWIEHRCMFRTEEYMLASRAYQNDRALVVRLTGQEDNQEGLPEPQLDYKTEPPA